MKNYGSKDEIYKDYAVALKFGLERPVHVRDYKDLFDALNGECGFKVREFSRVVKNFRKEYPIAAGFFIEIPVKGDTGQELGTRFVLLEHETGWEIFLPLLKWMGEKVGEKVFDKGVGGPLDLLVSFMKTRWTDLIHGGVRIDHVEVRTENKGVMRLPFSEFQVEQVRCLLKKFDSINHLSECNQECFDGLLVQP